MLDRFFEAVAALLLSAITLLALAAVVARYVLNASLSWSSEVLIGLLVYVTFFCGYLALRQGAHLRIDVVAALLPRRGQWLLFFVNQALIGVVCVVMVVWGLEQTLTFSHRTTLMLGAPQWLFYVAVPISGAGMLLELVRQCVVAVKAKVPPYDAAQQASLEETSS
ncbi:C4-dicarboxylate ABC transporter permease [Litchfieldella anticariensis FP35 = DSM 16096]|uniref:TRAP transporter small permease protein n=1 Tax=Litchfieldella anticariensis (strain DSM 16096 / CECT 5854 / CIP 108499 / LMG 22089 / FP35) TaxID=1121939 RepID=S2KMN6_LITA3|nr:TRAP transporter small permease [Halomonas anticariensis]EPC03180.1 C4-dicarboxylate ABC transporter permease [Halomonas anticariensis FP35 = DSM 16096]